MCWGPHLIQSGGAVGPDGGEEGRVGVHVLHQGGLPQATPSLHGGGTDRCELNSKLHHIYKYININITKCIELVTVEIHM